MVNKFNVGLFFNRQYFEGVNFEYLLSNKTAPKDVVDKIKSRNNKLCSAGLFAVPECALTDNGIVKIKGLKIAYPGLVTGIGLSHEVGIEGEFKLGIHFDFTTGMPIIYGSSVKGVLREYFKDFYKGDYSEELIRSIFEGDDLLQNDKKLSIYKRDIFFDAVIVKADKKGRILYSDSITPHNENPLKNPTPLTFVKIAPGCELEFRFKLHDTKITDDKIFSVAQKIELFTEILTTVGIGAKTNVGYGQLEEKA